VNNLKDRREDLFTLKWKKKAKQAIKINQPVIKDGSDYPN